MTVQEFDLLLKRVNCEDDPDVKLKMLAMIETYFQTEQEVGTPTPSSTKRSAIVTVTKPETPKKEEKKVVEPVVQPVTKEPEQVKEVKRIEETDLFSLPQEAEPVKEEPKVEEEKKDLPQLFTEQFSLISTTTKEQLKELEERQGLLIYDQTSSMYQLFYDSQVIGLLKTPNSLTEKEIDELINEQIGVLIEPVTIGKIVTKGKARSVNITFRIYTKLTHEHASVIAVRNLLETGEEPKQEEKTVPTTGKSHTDLFRIHPAYVEEMKTKKEKFLKRIFIYIIQKGKGKLYTQDQPNGRGIVVAVCNEPSLINGKTLEDGKYDVTLNNYEIRDEEGKVLADITMIIPGLEEESPAAKQPTEQKEVVLEKKLDVQPELSTSEVAVPLREQKGFVLKAKGDVPDDFPLVNQLTFTLYEQARTMTNERLINDMVGKPFNIGIFTRSGEGSSHLGMMEDVFEMGYSPNVLTNQPIRDSKWIARVNNISYEDNKVTITFDHLVELGHFSFEDMETSRDIHSFDVITLENYAKRQEEKTGKKFFEEPVQPEVKTTPSDILNKQHDPNSSSLLEPKNPPIQEGNPFTQAIAKTVSDTHTNVMIEPKPEMKQQVEIEGTLQEGAGSMSQTETAVAFTTGYPPDSWKRNVGNRINLQSELDTTNPPLTRKFVSIMSKSGTPIAEGQVSLNDPLFLDGSKHSAVILGIENSVKAPDGYVVSIRLGNFIKTA